MPEAPDGAATAATEDLNDDDKALQEQTALIIEGDPPGDDAAAATEPEAQAEKPKPKQTAQERIDELTRARREAERDRDFYKEQALRNPQPQPAPEAQQHQPQGEGRPTRADYENEDDYLEDLTDWKAEQAVERRFQQRTQMERVTTARDNFATRTSTLYPDGEPAGLVAFKRIDTLPVAVIEIVGDSDVGPKIAAHLGDNPAELRRLEGLTPIQQARELTRLETRLSETPRPTPKTATDAPEPLPQARGTGGRFSTPPDTTDFAAFEKMAQGST